MRGFTNLVRENHLGEIRRLDQREALKNVIQYCKENEVELLLIAGDLYEQKYIRRTTIEYVNELFKQISNTQILIVPGNHDPYIKNSFYNTFTWSPNVKIFNGDVEKFSYKDCDIYGFGFTDFYMERNKISEIKIEDKSKINILLTHGSLNASDLIEKQYNPISQKELEESDFDYIALGHIHKQYYNSQEIPLIVYPGSLISLGFDEQGEHGMIIGEIEERKINIDFLPIDKKKFKEISIDVTEIKSKEEIAEKINEQNIKENEFIKIILIGKRKFDININAIYKLTYNKNIIKIKDFTKIDYDIDTLSKENTLRGIFIKNIIEKIKSEPEKKELYEKAIEIGLDAIDNS